MNTGEEAPLSRSMPPLKLSYCADACGAALAPIGVAVAVGAELDGSSSCIQSGLSSRGGAQSDMSVVFVRGARGEN